MLLARVVGVVVAEPKADELAGVRLALIRPVGADLHDRGKTQAAVDTVGAGEGQMVFTVAAGPARAASGLAGRPVDLAVVGIVDELAGPGLTWEGVRGPQGASASERRPPNGKGER